MKVVDANVLLYAVNTGSVHHDVSRRWLEAALGGTEAVGLPWVSLLAFLRISTKSTIFTRPLTAGEALNLLESWLASPAATAIDPGRRHVALLAGLLSGSGTAGNLTTDAHIAAIALEYGATVVTFDRDFARFDVPVLIPH